MAEIVITVDDEYIKKIEDEIVRFRLARGYVSDFATVRRIIECLVGCNIDWDTDENCMCTIAGYVQCEDDCVSDGKFDHYCEVFGLDSAEMAKELHVEHDVNQRDVLIRLMRWIAEHKKPKRVVRVLNEKTGKMEVVNDDEDN